MSKKVRVFLFIYIDYIMLNASGNIGRLCYVNFPGGDDLLTLKIDTQGSNNNQLKIWNYFIYEAGHIRLLECKNN